VKGRGSSPVRGKFPASALNAFNVAVNFLILRA
jgi:hypothetical protein